MELQKQVFAGPHSGPHLLVTGGVHGDEFAPMATIRRIIRWFQDQATADGHLEVGQVTLVPVVNEAAFARGHRCAEDNLDLARVCPGDPHGTITERTADALSQLIAVADFYIDLHTGGTVFNVLPLAGYTLHEDAEILARQRQMATAFNLPVVWGTSGELQGRSLSVARDEGVPAIYTEYHGSGGYDPEAVEDYFQGCLNVMAVLGMITRREAESRVQYVVEDARPASGHLQVCNPAAMSGFFEPHVALGETVARGQLLGTISDPLGMESIEVRTQQAGLVLVLRNFSLVKEGESVGVVLETAGERRG